MANKTITTPSDIINFAALPKDFPKCELRRIRTVELKVFRECIGEKLREELCKHLADYKDCVNYEFGATCPEGKVVSYNGVIHIATKETTEPPSNSDCWSLAPRFDKPCLEKLWCDVLAEYLAYSILIPTAPLLLSQIKNGTIVRIAGRDLISGNEKDLKIVINALKFFRDMAWDNLVAYIEKNNEDGCYDGFKLCKPCKVRKKRNKGVRIA